MKYLRKCKSNLYSRIVEMKSTGLWRQYVHSMPKSSESYILWIISNQISPFNYLVCHRIKKKRDVPQYVTNKSIFPNPENSKYSSVTHSTSKYWKPNLVRILSKKIRYLKNLLFQIIKKITKDYSNKCNFVSRV